MAKRNIEVHRDKGNPDDKYGECLDLKQLYWVIKCNCEGRELKAGNLEAERTSFEMVN